MPIIEKGQRGELYQGDILKEVVLYETGEDESAIVSHDTYGLVLSRNCKSVRSVSILVAAIALYGAEEWQKVESSLDGKRPSMDEIRRRFDAIRNGEGTPDVFYLGELPHDDPYKRFAARLDRLHTIQIPLEGKGRQEWIDQKRIGRLSADYRRHLHARLFRAFATEGFDDLAWWSDEDLRILVRAGKSDLSSAQEEVRKTEESLRGAVGKKEPDKKIDGLKRNLTVAQDSLRKMQEGVQIYEGEWKKRRGDEDVFLGASKEKT